MVKIRVLTENDQSLTFDLVHDLLVWNMNSSIQVHHFDLVTYFNSPPEISGLIDEIWSTDEKVKCTLKSQTLTFWSNLIFKNHISSKNSKYEI